MRLLLVLAMLPVIYVFAWLVSPLLIAVHAVITMTELVRTHVGSRAGSGFILAVVILMAMAATSRRFFWFGLLPLLMIIVLIART